MVSELAGEGAMPPQLPTPARRLLKIAKLRDCLRQQIQRGSLLLRRGVTKLKRWRRFSSSIVSGSSWSRSAKSFSKVLIIRYFFAIYKRSRSVKFSSRVLVDAVVFAIFSRSSRSRSAESSSAELVLAISSPQRRTRNKKQSIPPIPDFASEKSQRRVSDLKNRVGELRSEIKAATAKEAKQITESMKRKWFRGTATEIDPLLPPQPNFAVKKHLRSKPSRRIRTHSSATSEFQSDILQESSDLDSMSFLMLCFVLDLRCLSPPLLCEHAAVIEACAEYAEIIKTGLPAKAGNGIALVVCASKGSNNKPLTGVIFEPFEEVKKELSMVSRGPQTSLCRQKFVDDCEATINEQINVEYNVALKGLAKFFKESSEEERDHAEKLMEYQNNEVENLMMLRSEKGDALYAMELALSLEKLTNEKLLNLHAVICIHLGDDVNVSVTTMTNNLSSPPSMLSFAAELRKGNERVAKFFENDLEKVGADIDSDVNSRNYCGQTALMQACRFGHWKVVQIFFLFRHNVTRASRLSSLSF
nr:ferritin-3, chloroplastic [Ipomoea batatas]